MQIWEPCMPVLGSTPLLLRLPDLIVLPSTIFHRFLSLSLSLPSSSSLFYRRHYTRQ